LELVSHLSDGSLDEVAVKLPLSIYRQNYIHKSEKTLFNQRNKILAMVFRQSMQGSKEEKVPVSHEK